MSTQAARPYGPSALGGSASRFIELTLTLARTEFKLRYFGSVLGYLWSLMRPLLFFGVLYVFFTQIFSVGAGRAALRRVPADRASCSGTTSPRPRELRHLSGRSRAAAAQDPLPADGRYRCRSR